MTNKKKLHWLIVAWGFAVLIVLSGCVSTREAIQQDPDPFEAYNRVMFNFNDKVDKAVLKPVAKGYRKVMPDVLDTGVTNFFSNLDDVIVFANDLLQAKFEQAAMDASRIVYNTVFGVAGFFDVATSMDLPKHNEDFGQTLGYWGVGEGYFIVVPLFGPSTTRDLPGALVDNLAFDPAFGLPEIEQRIGLYTINVVDQRADLLRIERAIGGMQIDPYSFQREAYLQRRRNLVYDGNPPRPTLDFDEFEDFDDLDNGEPPENTNGQDGNRSDL